MKLLSSINITQKPRACPPEATTSCSSIGGNAKQYSFMLGQWCAQLSNRVCVISAFMSAQRLSRAVTSHGAPKLTGGTCRHPGRALRRVCSVCRLRSGTRCSTSVLFVPRDRHENRAAREQNEQNQRSCKIRHATCNMLTCCETKHRKTACCRTKCDGQSSSRIYFPAFGVEGRIKGGSRYLPLVGPVRRSNCDKINMGKFQKYKRKPSHQRHSRERTKTQKRPGTD